MRTSRLVVAAAATALIGLSAVPAFGADSGTVNARITVAAPCITVSPTEFEFPAARFGSNVAGNTDQQFSVRNCSSASEQIFAHGTAATNADSSASWALEAAAVTCPGPPNVYSLWLLREGIRTNLEVSNRLVNPAQPADTSVQWVPGIDTPCPGSSGAGESMTMQYVFVAAF